ncbi:MAG: DUF4157 domain-containing protein [Nostoc sp.]|uniref:eCIS core domain-containing protein n=1 Tax=Nostoc sp. TaxID=1180 RepID=UPI002FF93EEE
MREHVNQSKKATTTSFSIPSLKHRIPGFGLNSSQASPQVVPLEQPLNKPLTHDISRIPLHRPQAKLSISQPGDKYEQEADAIASQVISMSAVQPEMGTKEQTHSQVRSQPLAAGISPLVQQKVTPQSAGGLQGSGDFESRLNRTKGGGSPLPVQVQAFMQPRFGRNLSDRRVHTDSESVQMNRELGSLAFTHGNHIYYGAGKSPRNDDLTAHELTHTIQQSGGAKHASGIMRMEQTQERTEGQQALDATRGMRRGNRRASNENNSWLPYTKLNFQRDQKELIKQKFAQMALQGIQQHNQQRMSYAVNQFLQMPLLVDSLIADILNTGNCDEFASSTYIHTLLNTEDLTAYKVMMIGLDRQGNRFDHVFTITSIEPEQNSIADVNPDEAEILDPWYNRSHPITLSEFYEGDNYYKMELTSNNLHILSKGRSPLTEAQTGIEDFEMRKLSGDLQLATQEIWNAKKHEYEPYRQNLESTQGVGYRIYDFEVQEPREDIWLR